jgi:hypothetical protein
VAKRKKRVRRTDEECPRCGGDEVTPLDEQWEFLGCEDCGLQWLADLSDEPSGGVIKHSKRQEPACAHAECPWDKCERVLAKVPTLGKCVEDDHEEVSIE